jgi:hypothetical protein
MAWFLAAFLSILVIYCARKGVALEQKVKKYGWDLEIEKADVKLYRNLWTGAVQRMSNENKIINEKNQQIFAELNKRLKEQEDYITLLEQENFDAQVNWKEVACTVYANSFVASEDLDEIDEDTQEALERAYHCYLAEKE